MRVVEIRDEADFYRLQPLWNGLLQASQANTVFLTWEWINSWWQSYTAARGDLALLAAFDDKGDLRGIAPLRSHRIRRYRQTRSVLSFIGDGSSDSDYLDFIITSGFETEVLNAFRQHWSADMGRGAVLVLNEIPETSAALGCLRSVAAQSRTSWRETDVPCAIVPLPECWDDYLAQLRPRFRTKVRSVLRNVESRPEFAFGVCDSEADLDRLLPMLYDLHTRRWAQEGKPGVFGSPAKREFYRAISSGFLKNGWLRFTWLAWRDRIVACQFGFVYKGRYSQLQEGYEPACEHQNVGIALRAWSIRNLISENVARYDFLAGVPRHKLDWGAQMTLSKRVELTTRPYRNLLFFSGREYERRLKNSVKRILPEDVVTFASNLRGRSRTHGGDPASTAANRGPSWIRERLADCYLYSGLANAVRPVRGRYRLALTMGRTGSSVHVARRNRPTGRILIYHRVNENADPFLPAVPTGVFEEHMRLLAQRYKVVSLCSLAHHLRSDSAEDFVSITFDDGYEDNFQHALPILRRYGLQATIFLATGSIDAGRLPWFDQLAIIIRDTDQDYVDIETDLPARLYLRSQKERQSANGKLFEILRELPDTQRVAHLADIQRQLGAARPKETDPRMLSWDNIRDMKRFGIDFGGHTVTHPFMSRVSREQAIWEVTECKRRIEEETHAPVEAFAYPNGRHEDFSAWNADVLRAAGYAAAVTTIWGLNDAETNLMELKRGGPWERTAALFAWKLDWYQLTEG